MRNFIVLLVHTCVLFACTSSSTGPDAAVQDLDAPAACDAAAFAETLVGVTFRQLSEGDPSATSSDCELYRASVTIVGVDAATCSLSGQLGYVGMPTGGPTITGSSPFTCSLGDSAPTGVHCRADDIGELGGSSLGVTFDASDSADASIALRLAGASLMSCIDTAERVP